MSVPDALGAPDRHRPFPDPAAAILAFVASSHCCTFFQLALFLRWAWFGFACDATGPEANEKLRRAKSLVRKTIDRLVGSGLISKASLYLDTTESRSVCLFVGEPGSSLPAGLYGGLVSSWNGRGGTIEFDDCYCLPQRRQQVKGLRPTRSEPATAEMSRNDAMLDAPQSVALPRELEAAWLDFRRERATTGPVTAPLRAPAYGASGWDVESFWLPWPEGVADSGTTETSADHAKRRVAVGRCNVGGRKRVVVAPIVAYWNQGEPELMEADRVALMTVLDGKLAECGRRGQTLEVWAPLPIPEKKPGKGSAGRANA